MTDVIPPEISSKSQACSLGDHWFIFDAFRVNCYSFFLMSPNVYYLALLDWKVSVFMCIMNYTDRSSPLGDLLGRL